ncbi:MAG: hypothetical protein ACXW2T_03030, partial [Allosphingosinicella sp.]
DSTTIGLHSLKGLSRRRGYVAGQERLSIQYLERFSTEKPVPTFSGSALATNQISPCHGLALAGFGPL